ncbi:adenylate/guanylate cyclase domain-containing protein [Acinetobacter larvae]|uniref:Adenylate/guanylate cyclase domain-containing protein n=1 Tax=Acinetobacter larvae TaxID=1789224 RepID=A0A1B2LZC5_9GAMM|nr:adenylate/guanylate cyclase domain-containing protein [Acinetobacter larvae]AOA58123.1 adenylate/guanylate cyclase domain-containing protein [Acinetobacter larvae]
MLLNSMIYQGPRKFELYQRLMGYLLIGLLVTVYYFSTEGTQYQIYVPVFIAVVFLSILKFSRWLQYKYKSQVRRNILFLCDVIVVSVVLAAVHLDLSISFALVLCLIYAAMIYRISLLMVSMFSLIAVIIFYLNIILIFGFSDYFQASAVEITTLTGIGLILFVGVGEYYHQNNFRQLKDEKDNYFNEMNRYIELSNQLSRYAPLQLWQAIMRGETEAKLEYKRKKITIFFSDIQGFTELSERLIPDDLAFLLNDYLSQMTDIARQYGATIDKFMGDAILIFFGDPDSKGVEQDAINCVDMALAMRQQMKFLRQRWLKMGYPELHIRMGISTGYCHVGNYGTIHRMTYTIVGRDANLAARLQSLAEIDEILISDETFKLVKNNYLCSPKAAAELKGIQGLVKSWQVVEKLNAESQDIQHWFDYEYKGFHLLLNLEAVQNYEYNELIQVLEQMIKRIQLQQQLTDSAGVAKLQLEDEITDLDHVQHSKVVKKAT